MSTSGILLAGCLQQSGSKDSFSEVSFVQRFIDDELIHSLNIREPELLRHESINNIAIAGLGAETFDRVVQDFPMVECQLGQTVYRDPGEVRHFVGLRLNKILPRNECKISNRDHPGAGIASRRPPS